MILKYFATECFLVQMNISGVPGGVEINEVKKDIFDIDRVRGVHDLHIWSLIPGKTVLSAHVLVGEYTHTYTQTDKYTHTHTHTHTQRCSKLDTSTSLHFG